MGIECRFGCPGGTDVTVGRGVRRQPLLLLRGEVPLPLLRMTTAATSEAVRLLVDAIAAGSKLMGGTTYMSSLFQSCNKGGSMTCHVSRPLDILFLLQIVY